MPTFDRLDEKPAVAVRAKMLPILVMEILNSLFSKLFLMLLWVVQLVGLLVWESYKNDETYFPFMLTSEKFSG